MTRTTRSLNRFLGTLLVLATAIVATLAVSPSTALAGSKGCFNEERLRGLQQCPSNVPDACPDMAGMQESAAQCVAPAPAPAPAAAPAPAPAPAAAEGTPDEGFIAPPAAEFEHDSLTIQTAQADPPAVTGREQVIPAAGAADDAATAPGGGTSAAALPSGPLPYTGVITTNVAIAGLALLWAGVLSFLLAAVIRRPARDAA
jgi:hypothetical protein